MALSFSSIQSASEPIGIDPCFVHAVASVESANKGFNAGGTVIVRFEMHVFLRELRKHKVSAEVIDSARQLTGLRWPTLNKAISLHHEAALYSASFGMFQIMGFNHRACGFDDVFDFVQAMQEGEERQVDLFCSFVRHENFVGMMKQLNFAGFARCDNGPNYADNKYDVKLQKAFERCKGLLCAG